MIMLSVSYTGKKTHNIGKTSGVVRGVPQKLILQEFIKKIVQTPPKKQKKTFAGTNTKL